MERTWMATTLSEVEELISTVTFGKKKLNLFFDELQHLEKNIIISHERYVLDDLTNQSICLRGSIQATGNSLRFWHEKAKLFLQTLKSSEVTEDNPAQFREMQRKIYQLLKMVTNQTNRVQQMQQQLAAVNDLLQEKRLLLKSKIIRGQAPKLPLEVELV